MGPIEPCQEGRKKVTPRTCTSKVSNNLSFADALRGRVGKSKSSILKGWRCRDCGSWDVYAAVIGEHCGHDQAMPQQKMQENLVMGAKERVSSPQVH